jgi:hypothetical protein
MVVDTSLCKYRAIPAVAADLGLRVSVAATTGPSVGSSQEEGRDELGWNIFWTDLSVSHQRVSALGPLQKLNHFPDMTTLCNKATCASVLKRVSRSFPQEYCFYPRSWQLPKETVALRKRQLKADERPKVLIVKPNRGCQGSDISICRTSDELDEIRQQMGQQCVAQEYVDEPLLLDGYKFDLRIYACVTSCSPLRVHLYREGIARLCTEKYDSAIAGEPGKPKMAPPRPPTREDGSSRPGSACPSSKAERAISKADGVRSGRGDSGGSKCSSARGYRRGSEGENTHAPGGADAADTSHRRHSAASKPGAAADWRFRHLTNYAINKNHPDFEVGGDAGSKRLLTQVLDELAAKGFDVNALWGEVQQLVIKTLIAVQPHLAHSYASCRPTSEAHPFSCFELLGFDLLIDKYGQPWLLEVNHSPSLATDTPLDRELKTKLLADTMQLCTFSAAEEKVLRRVATKPGSAPPTTAVPQQLKRAHPSIRGLNSGSIPSKRNETEVSVGVAALRARLVRSERPDSSRAATAAPAFGMTKQSSSRFGALRATATASQTFVLKQQLVQQGLEERRQQASMRQGELRCLREEYEAANPGNFELVLPSPDEKLQSMYELLMNASLRAFVEESPVSFSGGLRPPAPPLLPPYAGDDWFSMIKLGCSGKRIKRASSKAPSARKQHVESECGADTELQLENGIGKSTCDNNEL